MIEEVTLNLTSRACASAIGTYFERANLRAIRMRGMFASATAALTSRAVLENERIVVVLVCELRVGTTWKF